MSTNNPRHKVFISYHHANDQVYKNELVDLFDYDIFIDESVDTGDIDENLSDEEIRVKIRDEYLRNSSVTIILIGVETKHRKHIDWEIYSSMFDGIVNKKSGILVINLPTVNQCQMAGSDEEKELVSPNGVWSTPSDYDKKFPYMPDRINDNFMSDVPISVVNYDRVINNPSVLSRLIDIAYNRRETNKYDLSRKMRRHNG